jgi:hypothetical protein
MICYAGEEMALRTMSLAVTGLNHDGRGEVLRRFARQGGAARIEREPGNSADGNAIAIHLAVNEVEGDENWILIGYVAADRAAIVAPLFDRKYFQNLRFVLRVDLQEGAAVPRAALELTYEVDDGQPEKEMRAARATHLVAELAHLRWDNIEGVANGDKVSLWPHPDGGRIHAYRRGSIGGLGFLGSTTHRRLTGHLNKKLPYQATIFMAADRAWLAVHLGM